MSITNHYLVVPSKWSFLHEMLNADCKKINVNNFFNPSLSLNLQRLL